ncbi:hypothetical protein C3747_133g48 [Trypanosoma cruzi]|uniref:Uncharacterized protein n=2 Tax=Trypanosoma cruzi TaxID=5693 RepID=Q4CZ85_TRYCC|nr:hypothetical protein, conserved [Trypanosoma cruzi]EAN85584.1 hypothetical protein, conserved [Trypanosoma cruzi]PWV05385.1 hypothetical protein C3747_133g48 [Trypanosoma cruzi]RNC54887.1 hypothetical protein TcCL_ESM07664 [Trypanosoma cruzi]|eukprot:XP_807435.1 hypothetical protein [Trypanosoma cruzi strain CL Brener]
MRWPCECLKTSFASKKPPVAPVPLKVIACGREFIMSVDPATSLNSVRHGVAEMAVPNASRNSAVPALFLDDKPLEGGMRVEQLPNGAVLHLHFGTDAARQFQDDGAKGRSASSFISPPSVAANSNRTSLSFSNLAVMRLVATPLSASIALISPELPQHRDVSFLRTSPDFSHAVQQWSLVLPHNGIRTTAPAAAVPVLSSSPSPDPVEVRSQRLLREGRSIPSLERPDPRAVSDDYVVIVVGGQTAAAIPGEKEDKEEKVGGAVTCAASYLASSEITASFRRLRVCRGYPVGTLRELFAPHPSQRIFMGDTAIDDERLTFEALGAGQLQRFSFRSELPIKKKLSEESVVKTSKKDEMKKNKGADDAAALLRVGALTECGGGGIECDKIPVAADKERSVSTTRGGEREERSSTDAGKKRAARKKRGGNGSSKPRPASKVHSFDMGADGEGARLPRKYPVLVGRIDAADGRMNMTGPGWESGSRGGDLSPSPQSLRGYGSNKEEEVGTVVRLAENESVRSPNCFVPLKAGPLSDDKVREEIYRQRLPTPPSSISPPLQLPNVVLMHEGDEAKRPVLKSILCNVTRAPHGGRKSVVEGHFQRKESLWSAAGSENLPLFAQRPPHKWEETEPNGRGTFSSGVDYTGGMPAAGGNLPFRPASILLTGSFLKRSRGLASLPGGATGGYCRHRQGSDPTAGVRGGERDRVF